MFTDILLHNMGLFPGIVDTISFEAILTSQKSPSKLKREKSVKKFKRKSKQKRHTRRVHPTHSQFSYLENNDIYIMYIKGESSPKKLKYFKFYFLLLGQCKKNL